MGEVSFDAFEAKALEHALREPKALQWFLRELALARDLDDPRTTRALDLVRIGLEYLVTGDESHVETIGRMHAVLRGTTPGGDQHAADLRDMASRVELVVKHWKTGAEGAPVLVAMLRGLGVDPGSPDDVDLAWLAARLDKLRAARGSDSKMPALTVARVVAEIAWRAGAHGAAERRVRPQYEGDSSRALNDFADTVRHALNSSPGDRGRRHPSRT